jgi:hypothetical protein
MTEARNTGDYGQLELRPSDSFVSSVIDIGIIKAIKRLVISYNTNSGSGTVYYRYSDTIFAQDDVAPSWIEYTGAINITNVRYYQVRTDA